MKLLELCLVLITLEMLVKERPKRKLSTHLYFNMTLILKRFHIYILKYMLCIICMLLNGN